MKLHRWLVAAAVLVAGSQVVGQSARTLTLEAIYDPASRVNFSGVPLPDVEWLDDNRYIVAQRTARGAEWVKVDAASGPAASKEMAPALTGSPAMTRTVMATQ